MCFIYTSDHGGLNNKGKVYMFCYEHIYLKVHMKVHNETLGQACHSGREHVLPCHMVFGMLKPASIKGTATNIANGTRNYLDIYYSRTVLHCTEQTILLSVPLQQLSSLKRIQAGSLLFKSQCLAIRFLRTILLKCIMFIVNNVNYEYHAVFAPQFEKLLLIIRNKIQN